MQQAVLQIAASASTSSVTTTARFSPLLGRPACDFFGGGGGSNGGGGASLSNRFRSHPMQWMA
jgi:hypothetical protein